MPSPTGRRRQGSRPLLHLGHPADLAGDIAERIPDVLDRHVDDDPDPNRTAERPADRTAGRPEEPVSHERQTADCRDEACDAPDRTGWGIRRARPSRAVLRVAIACSFDSRLQRCRRLRAARRGPHRRPPARAGSRHGSRPAARSSGSPARSHRTPRSTRTAVIGRQPCRSRPPVMPRGSRRSSASRLRRHGVPVQSGSRIVKPE